MGEVPTAYSPVYRVPTDAEHQQDGAVVERDEFKGAIAGVCPLTKAVLGSAFLGKRIYGSEFGEHNGRDDPGLY